jgi:hypothetical protein
MAFVVVLLTLLSSAAATAQEARGTIPAGVQQIRQRQDRSSRR